MDGDDRVAIAAGAGLALAGEADLGAFLQPLGKLDVDRLAAAQRDALVLERRRILEADGEAIADIGALGWRRLPARPAEAPERSTAAIAPPAEDAVEQVGEVHLLRAGALEAAGTAIEAATRPRTGAATAEAERHPRIALLVDLTAIILGALVLVGQDIIGARHLGEALGGLGIVLVAVRVELLGELPIGLLDRRLVRAPGHAQL